MSTRGASTTSLVAAADPGPERYRQHKDKLAARTTTHWFGWRHIRCKVEVTSDYMQKGWTLLQLHVIASRDTPCPITTTGYLSHGIDAEELATAGGAVTYLTGWMTREAQTKRYQKMEQLWRQGDLLVQLALTDEDRDV